MTTKPHRESILHEIVEAVEELTSDWGLDETLDAETRLVEDLCFASVDVMELMGHVDARFGQKLPYEKLLVEGGTYRADITLGELADFVVEYYGTETEEPRAM